MDESLLKIQKLVTKYNGLLRDSQVMDAIILGEVNQKEFKNAFSKTVRKLNHQLREIGNEISKIRFKRT